MTDHDAELIDRLAERVAEAVENDPEFKAGMDAILEVTACRIRSLLFEEEEDGATPLICDSVGSRPESNGGFTGQDQCPGIDGVGESEA